MIRIIFESGEIADCEHVERMIFDRKELLKEVKIVRNDKDGTYVMELKEVNNERHID